MYIFATTFECGQGIWPVWCMCASVYICMFDTYSKAPVKYFFLFTLTSFAPLAPPFLFYYCSLWFFFLKKNLYCIVCPPPMEQMWFVLIYSYLLLTSPLKNKLFFSKFGSILLVDQFVTVNFLCMFPYYACISLSVHACERERERASERAKSIMLNEPIILLR